ncbi:sensor histidine kinase [Streptomyces sp. NPDC002559]
MSTAERSVRRPATVVNAALGAFFALVLTVVAVQYSVQGRVWAVDACVGAVVCLIALGRERHRGWAAAAGLVVAGAGAVIAEVADLPGEPGVGAVVGLLVLGGSAARTLPWRPTVAVASAGLALMAAGLLTAEGPGTPFRVGIEGWILALGAGLGLRFVDFRRRAATDAVRQEERLALARELHDVVAHHITGIVVQAQAARIVAGRRPENLDVTLNDIEEAGGEALTAMRRVVGLLRDTDDVATTAPTAPGRQELTELVRRFDGHGPEVCLRLPADPAPWAPEVATTVHRIVQESLTNIARHAGHARSAVIDIAHGPDGVTVTVTDDAPPGCTRPKHHGGFGLIGMRERVEALGGHFSAGPGRDTGWSVRAILPAPGKETR